MIPNRHVAKADSEAWEQQIDAALQKLNEVQPTLGLHERLNARVPILAAHRSPNGPSQKRRWLPTVSGAFAALACACLLVVCVQHLHRAHTPGVSLVQIPVTHPQTASVAPGPPPTVSASPAPSSSIPAGVVTAPVAVFHLALTNRPALQADRTQALLSAQDGALPTQAQLDAQALADTNAPSHPAPTLELTAQERQIRLLLRGGERRQLAELNPLRFASRQQGERAELRRFFDPLPPPYPLPLPYIEQLDVPQKQSTDGDITNAVLPK